jgi:hypothetical protein
MSPTTLTNILKTMLILLKLRDEGLTSLYFFYLAHKPKLGLAYYLHLFNLYYLSCRQYHPMIQSESSSFSDSLTSNISTILERVLDLLNRMSQADALTLMNRLKRQNLQGADIGHLSRSTVTHILSEASGLRTQFRSLLEDDKVVLACTCKDMRLPFKFVKDAFAEMGQMRVILNDVILDPSTANRVRELSLNPGKADTEAKEHEVSAQAGVAGWMAKLFTPTARTDTTPVDRQAMLVPSDWKSCTCSGRCEVVNWLVQSILSCFFILGR